MKNLESSREAKRKLQQDAFIILIIGVSLIFILVCYRTIAYGWFADGQKAEISNIGTIVSSGTADIISANIYPVSQIDDNQYTFVSNYPQDPLPTLPIYDKESIDYHEFLTAVVIKIEYRVNTSTPHGLYISSIETDIDNLYSKNNSLSHVAKIFVASVNEAETVATTQGDAYTFLTLDESSNIVHTDNDNSEKILCELESTSGIYVKYFVVEYNNEIVDKIGDYRFLNETDPNEQIAIINYSADILLRVGER